MDLDKRIIYQANSSEEFNELNKNMQEFFKSYGLEAGGKIIVKKGIQNWIDIFPEKPGKIKAVFANGEPPKGYLRKTSPDFTIILIENKGYHINFNSDSD